MTLRTLVNTSVTPAVPQQAKECSCLTIVTQKQNSKYTDAEKKKLLNKNGESNRAGISVLCTLP